MLSPVVELLSHLDDRPWLGLDGLSRGLHLPLQPIRVLAQLGHEPCPQRFLAADWSARQQHVGGHFTRDGADDGDT